MKQQYRYTKPYRGKDPNFEKEELIENQFEEYEDDDGWDDAMEL